MPCLLPSPFLDLLFQEEDIPQIFHISIPALPTLGLFVSSPLLHPTWPPVLTSSASPLYDCKRNTFPVKSQGSKAIPRHMVRLSSPAPPPPATRTLLSEQPQSALNLLASRSPRVAPHPALEEDHVVSKARHATVGELSVFMMRKLQLTSHDLGRGWAW